MYTFSEVKSKVSKEQRSHYIALTPFSLKKYFPFNHITVILLYSSQKSKPKELIMRNWNESSQIESRIFQPFPASLLRHYFSLIKCHPFAFPQKSKNRRHLFIRFLTVLAKFETTANSMSFWFHVHMYPRPCPPLLSCF